MDLLQAGPTGSSGIFALNRPAMIGILMTQEPTATKDWILKFADAWEAGVSGAIIAPATVTNPAWGGSGGVDTLTLPSGAATIVNIPAGKAILMAELSKVKPTVPAPMPLAEAVQKATKTLSFLCIGLSPGMTPVPIPFTAQ
jgi:hypothetical protein